MIILTHGYFLNEDAKEQQIMKPYPPLGLLYLSGWLKQHQQEVIVLDTTFSSKEIWKEKLLQIKPKMLAFYINLMTKLNVLELVEWVRSQETLAHTRIVAGGPDVTYNVENYLTCGIDFIISGEGEQTILELTQAIFNNETDFSYIKGLSYFKGGTLIQTAEREKINDMSLLPIPDRASIDLEPYLKVWQTQHGKRTTNISTQRGCPYTCKWCSTAVYGQSYRRRPPALVAEEIEILIREYKVDALWFVDDVFTVSHKWLRELGSEFKARGIRIPFECITRAERLNEDILELLKEMGCFRIWIGAESGSQRILDAMDRKVDVQVVQKMIVKARESGIEAGTFIMLGYPGETLDDIRETARHLMAATPDLVTITKAYPIKGTSLYEEVEDTIVSEKEWKHSTDRDLDFPRNYSDRFYNYAIPYVMNSWKYSQAKEKEKFVQGMKFLLKSKLSRVMMHFSS